MSNYKIQTFTGKLVDLLNPQPETICIEDIAKALSQECRFGGQSLLHYSVAQHSIMVCGYAPKDIKLEALLHDAEEAYIKDLPTPLIQAVGRGVVNQYKYIKLNFRRAVGEKFGFDIYRWYSTDKFNTLEWETVYDVIHKIDKRMAVTERNSLFRNPQPLYEGENLEPYPIRIFPEPMIDINRKFLEMFELYRRDKEDGQ